MKLSKNCNYLIDVPKSFTYSDLLIHFENINEFSWKEISFIKTEIKYIWIELGKISYVDYDGIKILRKNNRRFCAGNYEYIYNKF